MSAPPPLNATWQEADSLRARGDFVAARDLLVPAADMAAARLGPDDPAAVETRRRLATVHRELGDLPAARRSLEEALEGGLLGLGDSDPLILLISAELGAIADELGNRHEARRNMARVARYGPAVLGSDHPYVRTSLRYLGIQPPPAPPVRAATGAREPVAVPPPAAPARLAGSPATPSATPLPSAAREDVAYLAALPPTGAWATIPGQPVPSAGHPAAARTAAIGGGAASGTSAPADDTPFAGGTPVVGEDASAGVDASLGESAFLGESGSLGDGSAVEAGTAVDPYDWATTGGGVWSAPPAPAPDRSDPHLSGQRRGGATGSRAPLIAMGVITLAVIAVGVAIGAVVFDRSPSGGGTAGAPPASTPKGASASAGAARRAPDGVRLRDQGASVTLTWKDPGAGNVPFVVAGGRADQPSRAFQTLPAGQTSYTVNGLNPRVDYCFTVVAVYNTDELATSALACTRRGSPPPSPGH